MPREKSRYRDRRSSSYSSESSYERKKSKSKHKRRSRSRDRSEVSSHRRRRSTSRGSRSKYRRRSHSRSLSRDRDRYESKSRRRSTSRSRSKRDRSRSISSSRSKSKHTKKKSKKSRSTSSRSSSSEIEHNIAVHAKKINLDDIETKVEKAIKAAEAAGLTMTKIPTYKYKEVEIKEDMPTIHDRNLLAELNSDSFVPKSFTSSRNKKHQSQNIVIDLNSQTVTVPETEKKVQNDDSIINVDEIPSEEELKEMWIQKLYHYRKKMVRGET
ncbi:unnamed protein product [Arctia plantaginis]|uniref:Uncharacterized protein n=1 Tax=Arctia plantaginis TaxID=874455 RepID=A0A8S1AZB6_ARCPL|nr:unnamed protein product [Arctia plantaginis]